MALRPRNTVTGAKTRVRSKLNFRASAADWTRIQALIFYCPSKLPFYSSVYFIFLLWYIWFCCCAAVACAFALGWRRKAIGLSEIIWPGGPFLTYLFCFRLGKWLNCYLFLFILFLYIVILFNVYDMSSYYESKKMIWVVIN
jgi:hypothetical protein